MRAIASVALLMIATSADAQWRILDSHSTADLHGIDAVSGEVAWASGKGAILHTEDGRTWQACTLPADAANDDFRNIQGFDARTAVVMSAGRGAASRLYRTADGCRSWTRVFDNPEGAGSFESLHRATAVEMFLLGDAIDGKLRLYSSHDAGNHWSVMEQPGLDVARSAGAVVGGTASFTHVDWLLTFGTTGRDAAVYTFTVTCKASCLLNWVGRPTPIGHGDPDTLVASVAGRTYAGAALPGVTGDIATSLTTTLVAVGGDPAAPDANTVVAASSTDSGGTWRLSGIQPGGYRSSVAFDARNQRFIAVGPNGTDVTTDDGMAWRPLRPRPGEPADADQHWNSISLPFVVGAKGRIGRLD